MTIRNKKKSDGMPVQEKFATTRAEMADALIERDGEIDMILTSLICGEHPLLVGPPGTAKSMTLDMVMGWISDASNKFSVLFNKFTTPEEVYGPVSVQGLKQDVYRRIITGKLPSAHFGFGDEIFKASTAILNTLLKILNERVYENGDGKFMQVPLIMFVGASNEWPNDQDGGKELGALFDRFLLRKTVKPIVGQQNRLRLLFKDLPMNLSTTIGVKDILEAKIESESFKWRPSAMEAIIEIINELAKQGIKPGDRRQRKSVNAVRAFAYLCGSDAVEVEHLEICQHVLWDDPNEQPLECAKIVAKIANPVGMAIVEKLSQVQDICDNSIPTEAVPKLKAIRKEMDGMSTKDPVNEHKLEQAKKYVSGMIDKKYKQVIGEE